MNESRRDSPAIPTTEKEEERTRSEESWGATEREWKGVKEGEGEGPLALSETVATEACDEFRTGTERERRRVEREGGERVSLSVVFHFILFYFISLSSFLSFFYHLLFFFLAALLLPLLIYRCCRAWPAGSFLIFLFFTFFFFLLREESRALPITPCVSASLLLRASITPARTIHPVMRVSLIINSNLCRTLFFGPLSFHRRCLHRIRIHLRTRIIYSFWGQNLTRRKSIRMKEFVKRIIQFVDKFSTRLQFGSRKEEKGHKKHLSKEWRRIFFISTIKITFIRVNEISPRWRMIGKYKNRTQ